jgi:hypothetical protein
MTQEVKGNLPPHRAVSPVILSTTLLGASKPVALGGIVSSCMVDLLTEHGMPIAASTTEE